jgi:uncharacterized iron-regulated membrane protein
MFRSLRVIHKWIGLFACLFLMLISVTGFLLAFKSKFAWLRPEAMDGQEISSPGEVVSIEQVYEAALGAGYAELSEPGDIDRLEYRPKNNMFKVTSKDGYREVQVDGATGEVLSRGQRNDQLTEDLHDLSWFSDPLHDWVLPAVGVGLFTLSVTGVFMFSTPIYRRWKFKKKQAADQAGSSE